jgi:hypothetical protein
MSFITKVEMEFPDLHVIWLADGRVIGVNEECIVLYENIDDLFEGGTKDRPTINLYREDAV